MEAPSLYDFSNILTVPQIEVIKELSAWKGLRPFIEILLERELPETPTPKQIESDAKELLNFYRAELEILRPRWRTSSLKDNSKIL